MTDRLQADQQGAGARSPLLDRPDAVPAEGLDAGVAWHYGDPVREQRLLAAGRAVTDLSHRGVLRVTGPDRLSWLHSLTTQALTGLAPGESTETLVLSPHGHVEHAVAVVDDGEASWLTVEPGSAPALAAWLDRMRFMLRVEVSDLTAELAVVALVPAGDGVALLDRLRDGATAVWHDPWPRLGPDTASYAVVAQADHPGGDRPWTHVLLPRTALATTLAGVEAAGSWAAEALRVAAWRPRFGHETDHRTIPHEVDWLRSAVHLTKGCYRGQETVARVHNLGRPPRRLVLLHLDGAEHVLPAQTAPVRTPDADRPVGFVTSAVRHHELGPLALALVKRSLPTAAPLLVEGIAAAQEPIVRG